MKILIKTVNETTLSFENYTANPKRLKIKM